MQDSLQNINKKITATALSYHLENDNLKDKIAVAALSLHLNTDNLNDKIAASALAIYLYSDSIKCNPKIIAQIALAIHLSIESGDTYTSISSKKENLMVNYSAWNNKILMMRQLPIRK